MPVKEKVQKVVRMTGLILAMSTLLLTEACTMMTLGGKLFKSSEKASEVQETQEERLVEKKVANEDLQSEIEEYIPDEVALEVQSGIREANELFERGDYRQATRKYDELLSLYQSEDKRLETALLTNMALSHLEEGDQAGFIRTAERLVEASNALKYLSRETQVVLKLIENMDGVQIMSMEDQRIEQRISKSINETFGKEEE